MPVIKPGKIAVGGLSSGLAKSGSSSQIPREIWDDYAVKKGPKKKEYRKGSSGRMVPTPSRLFGEEKEEQARQAQTASEEDLLEEPERETTASDFQALEERLGREFVDRELLQRALTHRSAVGIKERADYERLEFLGDAVLDLAVAHVLSDRYPEAREGELSKMRAALVNTQALAEIGRQLEIGEYIRLGRGEFSSGGNERPSILADVMEAIIGAIYRDSSYEEALGIIQGIFGDAFEQVTPHDPKTELQEVLHAAGSEPPTYLLELVEGPEHAPTFVMLVLIDGEVIGRGRGTTKKGAQQAAADEALSKMRNEVTDLELLEGAK